MGDRTQRFKERKILGANAVDYDAEAQRAIGLLRKGREEEALAILKEIYHQFPDEDMIIGTLIDYSDFPFINELGQQEKFTALYVLDKLKEEFGQLYRVETENQYGDNFEGDSIGLGLVVENGRKSFTDKIEELSEDPLIKDRLWTINGAYNIRTYLPSEFQLLRENGSDLSELRSYSIVERHGVDNFGLRLPNANIDLYVSHTPELFKEKKLVLPSLEDNLNMYRFRHKWMTKIFDEERKRAGVFCQI